MSDPLIKLESLYRNLTKAEKSVATYILNNPGKAPLLSVSKLAKSTKVSVATVSRLSKKAGYRSFQEFKIQMARGSSDDIGEIYKEITPQDTDKDIIKKVFSGNIKSLEDTRNILDHKELTKASKAISKANRVVFFGIASSGYIAMDAALRFTLLDIQAEAYSDPQQMIIQSLRLRKGDVAVGISHSGRSKIVIDSMRLALDNKVTTIGMSNYLNSPLNDISRFFLCTAFSENRVKVAALSSRISQMCIIDTLYLLAVRGRTILKETRLFNDYAEKFLRL